MATFYFNDRTGKVHIQFGAGGRGGGMTSIIDVPATEADFTEHPADYAAYLAKTARQSETVAAPPTEQAAEATPG